jgi:hypothetical protein
MAIDPKTRDRYYISERFSNAVPQELKEAWRLAEDNMYHLRDRQMNVEIFTLTGARGMNINTIVGKPLLVILIQDVVGGWAVSWPAKFQDSASLNLDLTANTYTCILWYPISAERVLAVAGSTGVALAS